MASKLKVTELSDDELRSELKSRGVKYGPITKSTRLSFERVLAKAVGFDETIKKPENNESDEQDSGAKHIEEKTNTNLLTECTVVVRSTSGSSKKPSIFYGVCFDADSSYGSEILKLPAVFHSKEEALNTARKVKGARFKGFKSKEDAETFSRSSFKDLDRSPVPLSPLKTSREPGSIFKSPTPQELIKFRKLIEQGKDEKFIEAALTNPRYLIAAGDTPVILQEGFRYNALHVAAKSNQNEMCRLIIETLENDQFWKVYLAENFSSMMNAKRKQFLVDMYINTPDSGCLETPLHFACKFGYVAVVEYLISHPLTDVNRQNKFGDTPTQVICTRCSNESSGVKSQITSLLEDNCFVPLLGSEDNSTPPRIGNPWSPDVTCGSTLNESRSRGFSPATNWQQQSNTSPGEPGVTVRAYAGPMSPSKAAEFYHLWKTPPLDQEKRKSYIQIKRKDDSRGVERIGREIAHNRAVPWNEYWSFLGSYTDLSSEQGLKKLDQYLANKQRITFLNRPVTPIRGGTTNSQVLKTPESRQTSVIVNDCGFPRESAHSTVHGLRDKNPQVGEHSLPAKKMLFTDPEVTVERESIAGGDIGGNSLPVRCPDLNQYHGESCSIGSPTESSSLENVLSRKSEELVAETVRETLEAFSIHQRNETGESKMFTQNSEKKDFIDSSHSSDLDEKRYREERLENALACKKELSYNLQDNPENSDSMDLVTMETGLLRKIAAVKDGGFPANVSNSAASNIVSVNEGLFHSENQNTLQNDLSENPFQGKILDSDIGVKSSLLDPAVTTSTDASSYTDSSQTTKLSSFVKQHGLPVKFGSCSDVPETKGLNVDMYIEGLQPSKLDVDVLLAIGQAKVDPIKFPSVARWKKLVSSYSNAVQQSWPSPGSPRYARQRSLLWSC